ncbi:MAG: GNAT family N-acetyltransferase [Polyangiaceae bacterium]|nr:GNAT family N-acetyltransferase [Polyangiaceae bacterium]
MKTGPDFRREVELPDGGRILLRMMRPEDRAELRRQFSRLSPGSRFRRFLTVSPELSEDALRYLTDVDGQDHVAIVATADSLDLKAEVGLGVGRFVRLRDEPDVAEAAVTVIDEAQGRGIGRRLLEALTEAALERGIRCFRGVVLAENEPMRRILDDAGARVREDDGASLVFDVDLTPRSGASPADESPLSGDRDHPLWRLLRIAAQSLLAIRFGKH